ncbi:undecaprenyl/decaprenyl-phosphate alpha-N-acetylglucosaminyl 1-phosphate transferase [Salibacterium salarium]|uniref:Undecaprenyl/decaprenyl-phosphate alpha-N-acetylglucosaminyl 1-phosphate transferase n=1 Tax=Salibacterium salarium TaxID=284579 RepID=A0A428MUZ0_9BACI|nr:MraY family glycosyltransferase [Salibacterium salarium]RSL29942.1 undecaprenyl/decaprenyl-phosphate alpha-N-acetylglucosaminyl 1-phosphate transferase [Salibacterium salarium]
MITGLALTTCFLLSLFLTPLIKKLAFKIGATDQPNHRKVHKGAMARLGGLSIYVAFLVGLLILQPENDYLPYIMVAGTIIIITGFLDDMIELSAKWKLLGQILAAVIVIMGGVQLEFINLPFDGRLHLGWFSIPITLLWIIGITNAINLIDGLDGLAAGVSSIVLATVSVLAIIQGDIFIVALGIALLGGTLGFLVHNFNPAKIFMGDSGALFLGFMIGVISLLGFKNVTIFSLVVPVIILAVPISDTFFAIIRRVVNKQPLSAPDKSHLHHCLLRLGYSHKQTVLIIYALSLFFGLSAVVFTISTLWVSLVIMMILLIGIELMAEQVGLVNQSYRPMKRLMNKFNSPKRP